MEPRDTESNESNKKQEKIAIVDALPSSSYKPTVNLAMLQIVIRGKLVSSVVIQRYDSDVPGQEPVYKPLPTVVARQETPLIVVPGGASRN